MIFPTRAPSLRWRYLLDLQFFTAVFYGLQKNLTSRLHLDVDAKGREIGFEILDSSKRIEKPRVGRARCHERSNART
jgi:hypothetical protein